MGSVKDGYHKEYPVATAVLDYFPDALLEVSRASLAGNKQHGIGEEVRWVKGKSNDHPNSLIRHFLRRGEVDIDGVRHSAKAAWRALALLQIEIEEDAVGVEVVDLLHEETPQLEMFDPNTSL